MIPSRQGGQSSFCMPEASTHSGKAVMQDLQNAECLLHACAQHEGGWRGALRVRALMRRNRAPLTVHVYNALLAACERARQWCAPVLAPAWAALWPRTVAMGWRALVLHSIP